MSPNVSPFWIDSLFDMVGLSASTGHPSAAVNPLECLYPSDGGFNCNRLFAGNDVYQQCCWFEINKTVFTGEYLFDIDN